MTGVQTCALPISMVTEIRGWGEQSDARRVRGSESSRVGEESDVCKKVGG